MSRKNNKDQLAELVTALDASERQLCRDDCRDWQIAGRWGHIYAKATVFHLILFTDECDLDLTSHRSARRWGSAKQRLAFAPVIQDGEEEGILELSHLPTPEQAIEIRHILGIRQKRHLSEENVARLAANLAKFRGQSTTPAPRIDENGLEAVR
jgi:hypothetical protein